MDTAISVQIAGLSAMNKAELLSIWAKNFRAAPPCIAAEESDGFHPCLPNPGAGVRRPSEHNPKKTTRDLPRPSTRENSPGTGARRVCTMAPASYVPGRAKSTRYQSRTAPLPITANCSAICPKSRERSMGHVGLAPCSSERKRKRNEPISPDPMRNLHPQIFRRGLGSVVQFAPRSTGSLRGIYPQPAT